MIYNKFKFFFKNQIWHLGGLIFLFYLGCQMVDFENNANVFLGISSKNWFLFSMMTPLLHQGYVWLCWRSELCWKTISRTIGFKVYVVVFFILGILRLSSIGLCFADYGYLVHPRMDSMEYIRVNFYSLYLYNLLNKKIFWLFKSNRVLIILIQVIKIFLLKKEAFLNGLLMPCTLLLFLYFLVLLFLQVQKQCLYLLYILLLARGYIISVQKKKILK